MRRLAGGGILLFLTLAPFLTSAQSAEEAVRNYFADTPVMIDIARCESKFTQFNESGEPLHGGYQSKMIGIFQIYEDIHAVFAKGIGMDIYTQDGNMAYAKNLYEREGTQPWMSSFPCWGKDTASDRANVVTLTLPDTGSQSVENSLTVNLSFGMEHPQVRILQKILNEKNYLIAPDGLGSPGNETIKFGLLTRAAVRKYQCAENIACDGDEHTTGYGFVGEKTRAALASRYVAPPRAIETPQPASEYTPEEQKQIALLQAQIVELTRVLNTLLAAR